MKKAKNVNSMTKRNVIAIAICALFALTLLFSIEFIAEESNHDCAGEHCAICAVLQVAEEICGGIKRCGFVSLLFLVFATLYVFKFLTRIILKAVTPISLRDIQTT